MDDARALDPDFESFWKTYPARAGSKIGKAPARKEWAKLKPEERFLAAAGLAAYARAAKGYPRDAERYLKHRLWEGLEVETREDRDRRTIAGAEAIASFLNVEAG